MAMINSILIEPGQKPTVYKLSEERHRQVEEISALLGGNFAHTKLFDVGNGIGLYLFVNDLAVPLGLKPNRTFPAPDEKEIIFGNALFLAMADNGQGEDAVIDIPPQFCDYFVVRLDDALPMCKGDEKPDPALEIFTENAGTPEEFSYRWVEIDPPKNVKEYKQLGAVRMIDDGKYDTIEINGRFFKQQEVKAQPMPMPETKGKGKGKGKSPKSVKGERKNINRSNSKLN